MSYRQEIHGQLFIPGLDLRTPGEIMEEVERKKRLNLPLTDQELILDAAQNEPIKAPLDLPKDLHCGGFGPDVIIRTGKPTIIGSIPPIPEDWDTEEELMGDNTSMAGKDTLAEERRELIAQKILQAAYDAGEDISEHELQRYVRDFEVDQKIWDQAAIAGLVEPKDLLNDWGPNFPEPEKTEEEKIKAAQESWEYNKMTQDLPGEIPPSWYKSELSDDPIRPEPLAPPMREWGRVTIPGPGTTEAAVEDEALRRDIRAALTTISIDGRYVELIEASGGFVDAIDTLVTKLPELLGRYEVLFALAESYAKASPVNRNGVYISRRASENHDSPTTSRGGEAPRRGPQENLPGKDHM